MKRNFQNDGLSQPERLFAIGGIFFLLMALLSNVSHHLIAPNLSASMAYSFDWPKVYFCLAMIMGIISMNYIGIRGGWLVALSPRLSQMHFWLTFTGICFVLMNLDAQLYQESIAGMGCKWGSSYHQPDPFVSLVNWKPDMALSVYMILAGQFIWAGNFLYNLLIGNYSEE
ncbi:MAG: hypothetical protein KDD99_15985 [Bacteroidetes bacterium]|nr:hypothetical protein [Bacteroidota bacterium]